MERLRLQGEYPTPDTMERITSIMDNGQETIFFWTGKDVLYGYAGTDPRGGYAGRPLYEALRRKNYDLLQPHNKRLFDFLNTKLRKVA